jgi:hypothetical protein
MSEFTRGLLANDGVSIYAMGLDFSHPCFVAFNTPPAFLLGSFHWYLLWLYDRSDALLVQDEQFKGQAENATQDSRTSLPKWRIYWPRCR